MYKSLTLLSYLYMRNPSHQETVRIKSEPFKKPSVALEDKINETKRYRACGTKRKNSPVMSSMLR